MTASNRFLQRARNPFFQGGIVLGLVLLFNLGVFLLSSAGAEFQQRTPWTISATFMMFFAIFNALLSLMEDNMDKYWTRSILSYIGLVGLAGLAAYGISGLTINEAGSYKWIYIVLTFGYLLFLSLISITRKIVEFAQKEEWNHPRIRQKKKR